MSEDCCIPGYNDAIAEERRDRAIAFLGIRETIAGVEVEQLTPRRLEWLRATDNSYVCGGEVTKATILQFLWFVSPHFTTDKKARDTFIANHTKLNCEAASRAIDAYLDRAFLDAPRGKASTPYVSIAADLAHAMSDKPFHWPVETTLTTALPIIYQLLKSKDRAAGLVVINRKSDKVAGDWLDGLNKRLSKEKKGGQRGKRK